MKRFHKALLGVAMTSLVIVPAALANITDLTITATINSVKALQIEQGATVVSKDDVVTNAGDPAANLIITLDKVDAFGISTPVVTVNNGTNPTVAKSLLIGGTTVRDVAGYTGAFGTGDGAIYYVNNGYNLRAISNASATMNVQVAVTGSLSAIVSKNAANNFANTDTVSGLRTVGAAASAFDPLLPVNTPHPIDVGIYVPVGQVSGATSTVITFTGT